MDPNELPPLQSLLVEDEELYRCEWRRRCRAGRKFQNPQAAPRRLSRRSCIVDRSWKWRNGRFKPRKVRSRRWRTEVEERMVGREKERGVVASVFEPPLEYHLSFETHLQIHIRNASIEMSSYEARLKFQSPTIITDSFIAPTRVRKSCSQPIIK